MAAGASGGAPDWDECNAAQQLHVLGSPASAACATWRHTPGSFSTTQAHQGKHRNAQDHSDVNVSAYVRMACSTVCVHPSSTISLLPYCDCLLSIYLIVLSL